MTKMRASNKVLHDALTELGFPDLAKRAAAGEWSDYFGPHAMPQHHLIGVLMGRMKDFPSKAKDILAVIERTKTGDFDATKEEADEWGASAEGQELFRELMGKKK